MSYNCNIRAEHYNDIEREHSNWMKTCKTADAGWERPVWIENDNRKCDQSGRKSIEQTVRECATEILPDFSSVNKRHVGNLALWLIRKNTGASERACIIETLATFSFAERGGFAGHLQTLLKYRLEEGSERESLVRMFAAMPVGERQNFVNMLSWINSGYPDELTMFVKILSDIPVGERLHVFQEFCVTIRAQEPPVSPIIALRDTLAKLQKLAQQAPAERGS